MDLDIFPLRAPTVSWEVLDEECVLVHLDTGYCFSLNPVAQYIWEACDGQRSAREILGGLVGEFDVDETTAHDDLTRFLRELIGEGLIEVRTPGASTDEGLARRQANRRSQ